VRVIIDTNVLIAGLLWRGPPHALMEHARIGTLTAVSSANLIAELKDVLGRTKFAMILSATGTSLERMIADVTE